MRYAVVVDGVVVCVADWDGQTEWEPPFGGIAIPVANAENCEAGWRHDPALQTFLKPME